MGSPMQVFTEARRKDSETVVNKSAATRSGLNYVIDGEGLKVIDRDDNKKLRQIKAAL